MTELKFDDVEIHSFRGIKQYDLIFDQKSLVFCGANGTGKSSFVNAIEYLFTGKVENLSGIADVDHKKSIVHKGDDPNDLLVRARIGEYTIERSLKNGFKCDEELMDLKRDFENGSFILNRKKLLSFIESTPRKRYDRITELISYEKYDKIEDKLRWVSKSINKQLKAKKGELNANENELEGIFNCDLQDIFDEINAVLEKNNLETLTKDTNKKEFVKKFTKKEELDEGIVDELSYLNNAYLNLLDEYENIALNEFKSANALLSLLKKSEEFIQSESPSECPICHSKIDDEIILADIKGNIRDLQEKNNELNNWKSEARDIINGLKDLDYELKDFDLRNFIKDLEDLSNFNRKISEMDRKTLPEIKIKIEMMKEKQSSGNAELNKALDAIFKLIEVEKINEELNKLNSESEKAEIAYTTFAEMKKESIKNILDEIDDLFSKYYKFIHEHDAITDPQIDIKSSNGLTLRMYFDDDLSDPRTFSSEGHIDTLGLCIFLAFAKRFNKYEFLILDDIISTVDLEHKEQIIRLLFKYFGDYTFVITTHNKLWFEQLSRIVDAKHKRNSFKFYEIKNWNKNDGPRLSEHMTSREIIEKYIEYDDNFAAGNAIRRYLENILYDICLVNSINMPLKKHYTVEEFYGRLRGFKSDLFKGECNQVYKNYYDNAFEELDSTAYMGNLLSHRNEENYDLDMGEIIKFRDAVYNFEKAFKCEKHDKKYLRFNIAKKKGECTQVKCNYVLCLKKIEKAE